MASFQETALRKLKLCGLHPVPGSDKFIYKGVFIDIYKYSHCMYLSLESEIESLHLQHLMRHMFGRFRTTKFFVVQGLHDKKDMLGCNWMYVIPVNDSVILMRKPRLKNHVTVTNCNMHINNCHSRFVTHQHTQHITWNDKALTIYFDPPVCFLDAYMDLHIEMFSSIADLQPLKSGLYPRWNKLECYDVAEKDNFLFVEQCKRYYSVRSYMTISHSIMEPGQYTRELNQFRAYAQQIMSYYDAKATLIQRAWRRCISNPAYAVCRQRLLQEFEELLVAVTNE